MPKRYFCDCPVSGDRGTVVPAVEQESSYGEYVRFDDYQAMRRVAVERLLKLKMAHFKTEGDFWLNVKRLRRLPVALDHAEREYKRKRLAWRWCFDAISRLQQGEALTYFQRLGEEK